MKSKLEILFDDIQKFHDNHPAIGKPPKIETQIGSQQKRNNFNDNIYTDVSAAFKMDGVLLYYDVQRFAGEIGDAEEEMAYNRLYRSFLMYLITVRLPVWKSSTNSFNERTV